MKIQRNSILIKLLVLILTFFSAMIVMLIYKTELIGLILAIGVLLTGISIYAFALNKKP